jgi:hypothetical protein
MTTSTKGPRANASPANNLPTPQRSAYDVALCASIMVLIERDGPIKLSDLRLQCSPWATRGDVARTLKDLASVGLLRMSPSIDGPVVDLCPLRMTGGAR